MLEDSATDAEIVQRLLVKEVPNCRLHLAMNKNEFLQALDKFSPTLILADNSLPQFSAAEALRIVRERRLSTPFIMVTGTVSEEFAVDIIKSGANDYILKDRLTRLPAAIDAALKQHKAEKEKMAAEEEIRRSNERFQTLSRATKDAVWDLNLQTGSVWWSESFFTLLGYDPGLPVPDLYEWVTRLHPADRDKVIARLEKAGKNTIDNWEDELRFRLADGSYGTLLDRAYILRDDSGKPTRLIGVFVDITEQKRWRKKMEEDRLAGKIEQQKEVSRVILQTQEMERNALGRELHDNINQILASVNLKLGYYLDEPDNNIDVIENCRQDLLKAIQEARNLSHNMVMPAFSERNLRDELELLVENYSYRQIVLLESDSLNEAAIPSTIKETIFRIAQEHLNNIHKHAKASKVEIRLSNDPGSVNLYVRDNGVGFDIRQKRKGIGITNIFNRVESYNGTTDIQSSPGKGCMLSVRIPLPGSPAVPL